MPTKLGLSEKRRLGIYVGSMRWRGPSESYAHKVIEGKLLLENRSHETLVRLSVGLEPAPYCTLLSEDRQYIDRLKPCGIVSLPFRMAALQPKFELWVNSSYESRDRFRERASLEIPGLAMVRCHSKPIFISYSTKDIATVERIARQIERQQFLLWMAEYEIGVSDWFPSLIRHATSHAAAFVVFLSPASMASPWVYDELRLVKDARAGSASPTILPVIIEECAVPEYLAAHNPIDLLANMDAGLDQLYQRLNVVTDVL